MENSNLFSLNLLNFMRYKPEVPCDERVLFEALLIKYKSFKMKPFHYSKTRIQAELGIKRDRLTAIVKDFVELGFIKVDLITSVEAGQPRQVNYYRILPENLPSVVNSLMNNSSDFLSRLEALLTNKQ